MQNETDDVGAVRVAQAALMAEELLKFDDPSGKGKEVFWGDESPPSWELHHCLASGRRVLANKTRWYMITSISNLTIHL